MLITKSSSGSSSAKQPTPTVHHRFLLTALAQPRSVALICGEKQVSYSELLAWACGYAACLQAAGVKRGSMVALDARRSTHTIAAMLGILFAGGAYVPVDVSSCETPELLRKHGIEFLIASDAGTAASAASDPELPVPITQQNFDQVRLIHLDSSSRKGDIRPYGLLGLQCTSESPVYVMFTSGSTGNPKGVVVPHRAVLRLVLGHDFGGHDSSGHDFVGQSFMRFSQNERFLLHSPLHFDASTLEIWGALLHGGAVVIAPDRKLAIEDFKPLIDAHQVTSLWLTAGLFHLVAEHAIETFAGLNNLLAGGDVLSPEIFSRVARRFPKLSLINGYGPTENTTFTACYTAPQDFLPGMSVPIGTPIAGTTVAIIDEFGQPVSDGDAGQLAAGGLGVALGYLKQNELTAQRFVPDPASNRPEARMYLTGDRVRRRPDGQLEFLGRIDSEVKLSGNRVLIEEVEQIVNTCPAVAQSIILAKDGDERGKYLIAFTQWRTQSSTGSRTQSGGSAGERDALDANSLAEPQLREFLASKLPPFAIPRIIQTVQSFPLNGNGKVDRGALLATLAEPPAKTPSISSAPTANLQEEKASLTDAIVMIWQRLLQRDAVPVDENFFDLGGDSLSLIAMQAELRNLSGYAPTVMQLFSLPSAQSIADFIETAAVSAAASVLGQPGTAGNPAFIEPVPPQAKLEKAAK